MALSPNLLQPFMWGRGGAALTPEQVAREREIAEALVAQGIDTSPVGDWTQGAARMASVLAGKLREGRASSAETAGREAYSQRLSNLFSGGSPAQASISPDLPSTLSGSAGQSTAAASIPAGERADYIRQGLVQRGLPGHVADAFLLNFQDESGLDPGINEREPLVPGSRGGYGLYQLTGPRRRAYEAFASERGAPLDDIDAQLDFLMQEGSGTERAAFERILSAPDTGTAAVEIVNRFLRPAQEHRQSRSARYMQSPNTAVAANEAMATGSVMPAAYAADDVIVAETPDEIIAAEAMMANQVPSMPDPLMVSDRPIADIAQALTSHPVNPDIPMAGGTSGFAPAGTQAPNVQIPANAQFSLPPPQQQIAQSLAQTGGGQPSMQQLIELASDPWATDAQRQVVGALLKQQIEQSDPYRQAQLEKLRLETEALRNPAAPKLINAGDGRLYDPASGQWITAPGVGGEGGGPAAFETLRLRAREAGLQPGTPEYQSFMAEGGRTTRDPETERRVQALVSRGMPREQAENIVYGFTEIVSDPVLGSPMAVDRTTNTAVPIDQGIGGGQGPSGPASPPPGGSLYEIAEFATGAKPGIQETWTAIAPQFGLPGVDGITESRQILTAAGRDLVRALSINPRFPVGEMQRIEEEINIKPGAFTSSQALQERMRGVDTVLRRRLDNERRTASNPQLPVESRRNALQAANDIENFLVTLGVPQQGDAPQPGAVEDGYMFKGGDPADRNNWEPVN